MDKHFIVADNRTGIPFRSQDYMTREECENWIKHDIEECHKCGLDSITEADYEIVDTNKYR